MYYVLLVIVGLPVVVLFIKSNSNTKTSVTNSTPISDAHKKLNDKDWKSPPGMTGIQKNKP